MLSSGLADLGSTQSLGSVLSGLCRSQEVAMKLIVVWERAVDWCRRHLYRGGLWCCGGILRARWIEQIIVLSVVVAVAVSSVSLWRSSVSDSSSVVSSSCIRRCSDAVGRWERMWSPVESESSSKYSSSLLLSSSKLRLANVHAAFGVGWFGETA